MKPFLLSVAMLLAAQPALLFGQQNAATSQTELIQMLIGRIDQLEKRVAELEGSKRPEAATTTPLAGTPPAGDHHPEGAALQPAAGGIEAPNLKIAGFSDFTFAGSDQKGTHSGFNEGQFILHLNSTLAPKVSFLGELSLTARSDAGTGSPAATGFNAEIERSIIRYEHNDHLKLSFGRYHTPINYWNTAYHHGQWLQTTVSRPEMVQFGGSFIPVHFVGALLEGSTPAGGLNFNYNVGVGNGRGAILSRAGDAGDINSSRAWLVNTFIKPDRLYGLQIGGSAYHDKITTGGGDFNEWITSGHIVWSRETPEVIAEFANVNHQNLTTPSPKSNSQAYYVQLGYRIPILQKQWKPYYRFEYIHIPKSDTAFQQIPNLAGSVAGLRYDFSSFAALKFEYRNQRRAPGAPRINAGFVQTSFTF
jgi:hypothetical protein